MLFKFFLVNLVLAPKRLLQGICLDLQSNQVFLHPRKHVNELLLVQHLEVVLLVDALDVGLRVVRLEVGAVGLLFNQALFLPDLLDPFLLI